MPESAFRTNIKKIGPSMVFSKPPKLSGSEPFPVYRLRAIISLSALPASGRSHPILTEFFFIHLRKFFRSPHHLFRLPNFHLFQDRASIMNSSVLLPGSFKPPNVVFPEAEYSARSRDRSRRWILLRTGVFKSKADKAPKEA